MKSFTRPNVLLLYTDQQRKDSLGCYGNEKAITPNLDRLAAKGAKLNNFYVQASVCTPSRMSFLTGRYCSSLGVGTNGVSFTEVDAVPLHQLLKPYGYHTGQLGKLHFDPHAKRNHKDPAPDYGFDTFILSDEPGCYDDAYIKWVEKVSPKQVDKVRCKLPPAAYDYDKKSYSDVPRSTHKPYTFAGDEDLTHSSFVASQVCNYLENQENNEPFFAIAGFYAPHSPVNPPQRFVDMYDPEELSLPEIGENEIIDSNLKDVTEEEWRKIKAYYLALVSHIDDCVGQIIDKLKEKDMFDNTIIVFTSDHGEYLGEHGRINKGMPGHDCITNMPFIISYPEEISGGKEIEALVEGVDYVPTILDFCGIQTPSFVEGKSCKELLAGQKEEHKESVLIEHFSPAGNQQTTIKTRKYSYFCDAEGNEKLYDLKNDPEEFCDVSQEDEYKNILADMRKKMIKRIQKAAYRSEKRDAPY